MVYDANVVAPTAESDVADANRSKIPDEYSALRLNALQIIYEEHSYTRNAHTVIKACPAEAAHPFSIGLLRTATVTMLMPSCPDCDYWYPSCGY